MTQDVASVKAFFDKAKEIMVLLPQNPGPDSIAAALSLYLALEKAGKQAYIACSTPIDFSQYPLKQTDKIAQKIGNKNLVISLKVANRDSIDKVSYNLDEAAQVFNLIITPKKGSVPLASDAVSYSLAGAQADLIVVVGASSFADLGVLYASEPSLFTDTPTVAINRIEPPPFAAHQLASPQASSISEFVVTIIETLGLSFEPDLATNLLAAIDVVTDKLQLPNVSANTFEAVAKLVRAGGTRIMLTLPAASPAREPAAANQAAAPAAPTAAVEPPPAPANPPLAEEVPEDWLTPKIYKAPKK